MNIIHIISDYLSKGILTVKGDLFKRSAIGTVRLPVGGLYQNLQVNAAGDDLVYADQDFIKESGGLRVKVKKVDVGVWNMQTIPTIEVAHGLTAANIITVNAVISNDIGTIFYPISIGASSSNTSQQSCFREINVNNVKMTRLGGGLFNSVDFSNAVMNRGFIYIWYLA